MHMIEIDLYKKKLRICVTVLARRWKKISIILHNFVFTDQKWIARIAIYALPEAPRDDHPHHHTNHGCQSRCSFVNGEQMYC